MIGRASSIVVALLAGACTGGVGSDQAAISGGADDLTDAAVVGIFDNATGARCTGTLIAPDLVVSAQHCVAEVQAIGPCTQGTFGPPGRAADFYLTTRPTIGFNPNDFHQAAEIRVPPGLGFCGRDLVLFRLAAPIAAAEAVPLAPRLDPPPAPADHYAAIGYGGIDQDGTGADQRRRRDGLSVACVGDDCGSDFMNKAEWQGDAGVCEGDSGGPALDGTSRVIGVASRGAAGCLDPVYTMIAFHADWLKAEAVRAAGLGGYPVPGWAGGSPPIDAAVDAPPGPDADAGAGADAGLAVDDGGGGCCRTGGRGAPPVLALLLVPIVARRRCRPTGR